MLTRLYARSSAGLAKQLAAAGTQAPGAGRSLSSQGTVEGETLTVEVRPGPPRSAATKERVPRRARRSGERAAASAHPAAAARPRPRRRPRPRPRPQVISYKAHKCEPPSNTVTTTKAELMGFFTDMYRIRRMEISADMLYKAKQIRGFCHL